LITSLSCSGRRGCDLQLHVQSVPIATTVASSNPVYGEVYSIQHYVIKFLHWLATGQWFSPGTTVSSTNKTERHDITEILLKVTLNTINQPTIILYSDPCIAKSYTFDPFIVSKKGHGCKCEWQNIPHCTWT
jgi:hypothetical protein